MKKYKKSELKKGVAKKAAPLKTGAAKRLKKQEALITSIKRKYSFEEYYKKEMDSIESIYGLNSTMRPSGRWFKKIYGSEAVVDFKGTPGSFSIINGLEFN